MKPEVPVVVNSNWEFDLGFDFCCPKTSNFPMKGGLVLRRKMITITMTAPWLMFAGELAYMQVWHKNKLAPAFPRFFCQTRHLRGKILMRNRILDPQLFSEIWIYRQRVLKKFLVLALKKQVKFWFWPVRFPPPPKKKKKKKKKNFLLKIAKKKVIRPWKNTFATKKEKQKLPWLQYVWK